MNEKLKLVVSYARPDAKIAQKLAEALTKYGITIWIDYNNLTIGTDWQQTISDGIRDSDGLIIIASAQSQRSSWVLQEIRLARAMQIPLFLVVVDDYSFLPRDLMDIQASIVLQSDIDRSIDHTARQIAASARKAPRRQIGDIFATSLSKNLAKEASTAGDITSKEAERSVFIVHGHDDMALQDVSLYLQEIGVNPIILKEHEEQEDSLLRRFLRIAEQAEFAILIISPDDVGASLAHFEAPKGGEKALRYRGRQNVVLELGFFLGKLKDFNKVFVLRSIPKEPWPEFEMPSNLSGAIFKEIDNKGRWKELLRSALIRNGVRVGN